MVNEVPHVGWGAQAAVPDHDPAARAVATALAREPLDPDAIARATALPPPQVASALVALEIAGAVAREPGGLFRAVRRPGRG